ncbi:MAG TPA: glutathione S-transferase family protein [Allosphingosinicella sp.]|nr:glutathione S-transferase family protein [Allosphingosinicella sp.]
MTLRLYFHPFSSFCQKATTALYERGVAFEPEIIDLGDAGHRARLEALWPIAKFPVLRDEAAGVTVAEASLIVEYADRFGNAPPLVPADRDEALRARLWDRLFDLYVDVPMQKIVTDNFRPEGASDTHGVGEAKTLLARAYAAADAELAKTGAPWICGESFTMADCAAAPALFYANIAVPLAEHAHLDAYYRRLLARPSFARAVDEARPYRHFFPLEWPGEYS